VPPRGEVNSERLRLSETAALVFMSLP
jgi:hypothetical protein